MNERFVVLQTLNTMAQLVAQEDAKPAVLRYDVDTLGIQDSGYLTS
jgi:hypothetical protein